MGQPKSGRKIFTIKANKVVEANSFSGISAHGLMVPSFSTPKNRMAFRIIAIEQHMMRRITSRLSGAIIITELMLFAIYCFRAWVIDLLRPMLAEVIILY